MHPCVFSGYVDSEKTAAAVYTLNINQGSQNLQSGDNSGEPTYPANLLFLRAIGTDRHGVISPSGRLRYEKGSGQARVNK